MDNAFQNFPCMGQETIQPGSKGFGRFYIKTHPVESPTFAAIILLHVDDNKRGLFRCDLDPEIRKIHQRLPFMYPWARGALTVA
jgi:hypothetical protein